MPPICNCNGTLLQEDEVRITPNNRSFRYGDGCFETMKVVAGRICLADFHLERLFRSLSTLQCTVPPSLTPQHLRRQVEELVRANGQEALSRVRLVVHRGDGGLYDLETQETNYIIQSWPAKDESNSFNTSGLKLDIFPDARVTADRFSALKSNNYLRQAMGARYVSNHQLDDCILTNCFDRVVDTTIANIFIVSGNLIKTPPLSEGPVAGVMRRFLLEGMEGQSMQCLESAISIEELFDASEVFVTNAMVGIRWVKAIGNKEFDNSVSADLHNRFIAPLFASSTF